MTEFRPGSRVQKKHMENIEKIKKELEDWELTHNPDFCFIILAMIVAGIVVGLINHYIPTTTTYWQIIGIVLFLCAVVGSVFLSLWVMEKMTPKRIREIRKQIAAYQ